MSHPSLTQLLAHRHVPDEAVGSHLADCLACRRQVAHLEEALGRVLEPDLPALDEAVSEDWITAALDGAAPNEKMVPPRRVPWWAGWASAAALLLSAGALAMSTAVWWSAPESAPVIEPPPVEVPRSPELPSRTGPRDAPPPAVVSTPDAQRPLREAERPAPEGVTSRPEPDAPPTAFDETLFQEAADALARGDTHVARALLEILVELHPDADLRPLLLVEEGLVLRLTDPAAAAPKFAEALTIDPEGPLAADCRQWLCEAAPDHERCR